MNGYYQLVVEQLRLHGYRFDRAAGGSHEMWTNGERKQTVSKNMKSRDVANTIMRQAGLAHRFR